MITKNRMQKAWSNYITLWNKLSGWKMFFFYMLHYTVLFAIMWHFSYASFYEAGKTFIWTPDGMSQHFTFLTYFSQTVRNGIQSLLHGEGWTFPLYDFRLGPAKMNLQWEPVQWLAVLWPWDKIDVLYDLLVIARYYLVGLSFSIFGLYFKQNPLSILIGTVSYTFCGFTIYAGVRHPFFLAPMIYLPLLILGTEKVIRQERPYFLICIVFLAASSNLYFACMLAILTVLYAFVRFFTLYEEHRWKEFGLMIVRLAVGGGTGIALSGISMLPTLLQMADTGRIGRDISTDTDFLKYADIYYKKFVAAFQIIPENIGGWVCLGFSLLTIPAVLMLFIHRKKTDRILRRTFILLTVMLGIPAVGYVMSGFNAISNRWCFAYAFCCAVIVMFELPHFLEANRHEFTLIGIGTLVYFVICYLTVSIINNDSYTEIPAILSIIAVAILLICCTADKKIWKGTMAVCLIITCFSTWYSAFLMYDPSQQNYISEFVVKGMPYSWYDQSQYSSFVKSKFKGKDNGFYRVGGDCISRQTLNASYYFNINGITRFTSTFYTTYMDWCKEMELADVGSNIMNYGIHARSPMLTLANIKYYISRDGIHSAWPYGFGEVGRVKNEKDVDVILKNQYALPVGFTYDSYMTYSEYEPLLSVQKQEAQVQTVALKNAPASSEIGVSSPTFMSQQLPIKILDKKDVTWEDGKLNVTAANATMTIAFSGIPHTETYLRVVNLDLTSGSSGRRWFLSAKTADTVAKAYFTADGYLYSNGAKTQLLDLGYTEDGYTSVTLTFPQKGTFILDDLQIWCQPMDLYSEQIDALREETLENVETNWRGLTGTISVSKDKILCLSIPYDKGWSAYVDGKKVDLLQANTAFMAVELEAGNHQIELRYWTPGLTSGIILTIMGCAALAGVIFYWHKKAVNQK